MMTAWTPERPSQPQALSLTAEGEVRPLVEDLAGHLARLHAPLEDAFVTVGGRLAQSFETARNVTVLAEVLASRLSEPEIQDTLASLDRGAQAVADLRAQKTGRMDTLVGLEGQAKAVAGELARIDQLMVHLGIIGLNGKIQAAGLDARGADFSLFTEDTLRLAERGRKVLAESLAALGNLAVQVARAIAMQADFEGSHMAELTEVGVRLSTSIGAMRARQAESMRLLADLPGLLGQVHGRIGAVVSEMQFGDITRQRLEHSEAAMGLLGDVLNQDRHALDAELDAADLPLLTEALATLHASQIDEASQQFMTRKRSIDEALRWIAGMLQTIRAAAEQVHSTQDGSSFLMQIDHDLETVALVVDHFTDSVEATEASMQQVVAVAKTAVTALRDLDDLVADLNIIGLNASIRCGNVGMKGKALDVIAQELRGYARQARAMSDGVIDRLGEVIMLAEALAVDRSGFLGELADLGGWLAGAVERLRQAGGETGWVLNHIQDSADGLAAAIDDSLSQFSRLDTVEADLRAAAGRLRSIADAVRPPLSERQLQEERRRVLGFLAEHYTMASEREIHRLITGEQPADIVTAADSDLSDILF